MALGAKVTCEELLLARPSARTTPITRPATSSTMIPVPSAETRYSEAKQSGKKT